MMILAADDDRAVRWLLKRVLTHYGHESVLVDCAEALARRFPQVRPEAVICDVGLPDGDGVETCLELRRRNPGLPILIITGDPAQAERARRSGFPVTLEKPFAPEDLDAALRLVTGR